MALRTSRGARKRLSREGLFHAVLALALAAAAAAIFTVESGRLAAREPALRVWFFDVGQGDAVFIEAPGGEQMLIDAGRDSAVLAKLGSVMWPFDRTIDAIVATHPDADHIGGFPAVFARYDIGAVYETGRTKGTRVDEAFRGAIADEGARVERVRAGGRISLGELELEVLWPEPSALSGSANDASVVLLLDYEDTELLLTGDIEKGAEREIAARVGDIDVLKAAHHGSASSSAPAFLDAVRAETAVIQVGADNRYGHPHPVVLSRLLERGMRVLRTDRDGDILLISTGGEPEAEARPLPF